MNDPARQAMAGISEASIHQHLSLLGSDLLEGRGTGTRGGELAATYIANELRKSGIKPAGDDNSYYQQIPMHGSKPLASSNFQFITPSRQIKLEIGKDYLLYNTGAQTFIPKPAPLVFVGYGIAAPEYDYNDYQTLNVEGKIVVFLSGEPLASDPAYFAGAQPTIYSIPEVKQKTALARGAVGSIMIPSPRQEQGQYWQYWLNEFAFEDIRLFYSVTGNLSLIMSPPAARLLFEEAPYSLQQIFDMEAANSLRSFQLAGAASFRGSFQQRDFWASNVVGMLRGGDSQLQDSYVVISAHYDHLGIGPAVKGDSIYNGVFDNAAGVAAALEIAKAFAAMPQRPKRSLIFLFTTGEEKGLLGSSYYVDNPVAPLYKTAANVNVDGLAMFDTFNDVVGVGAELSTLGDLLKQVAGELALRVSPIPAPFSNTVAFARSDQISFAKAGVPALLIMEGADYRHLASEEGLKRLINWGREIYHTPFDDLQQPMNLAAARQHSQILFAFCCALANSEIAPQWKKKRFLHQRAAAIHRGKTLSPKKKRMTVIKRILPYFNKILSLMLSACAIGLQACSSARSVSTAASPIICIKGSDTMVILAQRWAEEFMRQYGGIAVYVEGGGTASGIEALIKGEIEICTASRPLQPSEVRRLAQQQRDIGIAHLVAKDGLSIYLHPNNPIHDLSLEQVKGIYTGRMVNWREVGGNDEPIVAFSRAPSSGTYLYFQEHVLEGQAYGNNLINMPTTAAIAAEVAKNPQAIGYGGLAYGKDVVHCKINGVSPTEECVREDKYPIARYLYFYTIKKPEGVVKLFIDWVLSKEGQRLVKEIDYIPLFNIK